MHAQPAGTALSAVLLCSGQAVPAVAVPAVCSMCVQLWVTPPSPVGSGAVWVLQPRGAVPCCHRAGAGGTERVGDPLCHPTHAYPLLICAAPHLQGEGRGVSGAGPHRVRGMGTSGDREGRGSGVRARAVYGMAPTAPNPSRRKGGPKKTGRREKPPCGMGVRCPAATLLPPASSPAPSHRIPAAPRPPAALPPRWAQQAQQAAPPAAEAIGVPTPCVLQGGSALRVLQELLGQWLLLPLGIGGQLGCTVGRFGDTHRPPPRPHSTAQHCAHPSSTLSLLPWHFLPNSRKTALPAGPDAAFPGVFNFAGPSWEPNKRLNLTNLAAWQPKLPLVFLFVTEPPR